MVKSLFIESLSSTLVCIWLIAQGEKNDGNEYRKVRSTLTCENGPNAFDST